MWKEYRFRKLFGGSHEDYLDQPSELIDWLLHIDNVSQEVANGSI